MSIDKTHRQPMAKLKLLLFGSLWSRVQTSQSVIPIEHKNYYYLQNRSTCVSDYTEDEELFYPAVCVLYHQIKP